MKSKERLKSLLGAITENPKQEEASAMENENQVSQEITERLGLSPDMVEQLNAIRKEKTGRPKGRKNGETTPKEDRATFIVSKDITRKLKYIALFETRLYKDLIT